MKNLKLNCSLLGQLIPSSTLAISSKAKLLKEQGIDVCSMSAGEPDFDTPQIIKNACIEALINGKTRYITSSGLTELKEEIVKKLGNNGISSAIENVVVTTGAKFAIFSAICAFCGPDDEVIIIAPYWLSYLQMIKASGAKAIVVKTVPANNYLPDKEDIEAKITSKTKLIIINSPNNPTGAVYDKATLQMIAQIALKHNLMVLSDEIYEKLIYSKENRHISIASLGKEIAERTITVNGFSKAYAMTGWRLGYLNAPVWLIQRVSALQSQATSNATSFVQYAGVCALRGNADNEVDKMIACFSKRRKLLCQLLREINGLKFFEPSGAFYVLCDISEFGLTADEFSHRLLDEKKLAVIPGTDFGAPDSIRLSYACSEENIKEAVTRLKSFCEGVSQ